MKKFLPPKEVLELLYLIHPERIKALEKDVSLKSIVEITKSWNITPEARLQGTLEDPYLRFHHEITQAAAALGLRQTKYPNFSAYDSVVIFGGTGLSYFKIWQALLFFWKNKKFSFSKIYLLSGNRPLYKKYDSLQPAMNQYPDDFNYRVSDEKIFQCSNEMEVMELITPAIKLPNELTQVPIISVFTKRSREKKSQASTSDTIVQLLQEHQFSSQLPILFMGTMPYIVRQGLEARALMPQQIVDTAALFDAYLESIDTPFKGDLPPMLLLGEIHCLLHVMEKFL